MAHPLPDILSFKLLSSAGNETRLWNGNKTMSSNYQLSYTNLGMREAFTNNSVRIFLTIPYLATELSATTELGVLARLGDELSSVARYGAPNLGLKRLSLKWCMGELLVADMQCYIDFML